MSNNILPFPHQEILPPHSRQAHQILRWYSNIFHVEYEMEKLTDADIEPIRQAQIECADGTVSSGIVHMENIGHYLIGLGKRMLEHSSYMRQRAVITDRRL